MSVYFHIFIYICIFVILVSFFELFHFIYCLFISCIRLFKVYSFLFKFCLLVSVI